MRLDESAYGTLSVEDAWRVDGCGTTAQWEGSGRGGSSEQGAKSEAKSYPGGRLNKAKVGEERGHQRTWLESQGGQWAYPEMET